jgi:hypothetical protein
MGFDPVDNQSFRSKICFSNQIDISLVRHLKRSSESTSQYPTCVARSLDGKVQQA